MVKKKYDYFFIGTSLDMMTFEYGISHRKSNSKKIG